MSITDVIGVKDSEFLEYRNIKLQVRHYNILHIVFKERLSHGTGRGVFRETWSRLKVALVGVGHCSRPVQNLVEVWKSKRFCCFTCYSGFLVVLWPQPLETENPRGVGR
jgi:hypothetical protein